MEIQIGLKAEDTILVEKEDTAATVRKIVKNNSFFIAQ